MSVYHQRGVSWFSVIIVCIAAYFSIKLFAIDHPIWQGIGAIGCIWVVFTAFAMKGRIHNARNNR